MQDQSSKSTTAIRARVFDPARRLHTLWLGGAAAMVGGIALATALPVWWIGYGTSMLGLVAVLAWEIRPRRRAADTMLTCMPGAIRTKQTGLIRARDIEGATTARIGERLALVLSHRRRRRAPIILELDDEPAADAIRKSLGVGHHGFGHIDFVPRPTSHEMTSRVVTIMAILSALAMLIPEPVVIAMAAFMLVLMLSLVVSVAIVRHAVPSPFARLTAGGVFLPTGMFVPFNVIEDVKVLASEVLFQIRTDRGVTSLKMPIKTVTMQRVGTTREELEHIVAQIRAASDRCHGQYTIKSEPEALAARLARGKDENDIDWHASTRSRWAAPAIARCRPSPPSCGRSSKIRKRPPTFVPLQRASYDASTRTRCASA